MTDTNRQQKTMAASAPLTTRELRLSRCAKSLLETLVAISNRAEIQELEKEAWISASPWFEISPMVERHRDDAGELIDELTNAGFVEIHHTRKRKKYKATLAGRRYCESLNGRD